MRIYMLALAIALLSLAGCAKPQYLIKGLTLPAGSTVINEMESTQMNMQVPLMGELDKAKTVNFDCSGGWDSVVSHVDSAMRKQGYAESLSELGSMIPGGSSLQNELMSGMRMWMKEDNEFQVMLMNNTAMMNAAAKGGGGGDPSALGMGEFTLTVIKYKNVEQGTP